MCGTLKHQRGSTSLNKIGDPKVPVVNTAIGISGEVKWGGFARTESTFWSKNANPVKLDVMVTSFVEGSVELKIPTCVVMQGLGLRRDVYVHGKPVGEARTLKILTREARSDFERSITAHKQNKHRLPLCIDIMKGSEYIFTPSDVVSGQGSLL